MITSTNKTKIFSTLFNEWKQKGTAWLKTQINGDDKPFINILNNQPCLSGLFDKITGSTGKGNLTEVPWIAFFNYQITNKASRGYYTVILFDIDGLWITNSYSIDELKNYFDSKKIANILKEITSSDFNNYGNKRFSYPIKMHGAKSKHKAYSMTSWIGFFFNGNNMNDLDIFQGIIDLNYIVQQRYINGPSVENIINKFKENVTIIKNELDIKKICKEINVPLSDYKFLSVKKYYHDDTINVIKENYIVQKKHKVVNTETFDQISKAGKEHGKLAEQKALEYLCTEGWKCTDVSSQVSKGYDIEAIKNKMVRHIEIKFLSNNSNRFFISKNEFDVSQKDNLWELLMIYFDDRNNTWTPLSLNNFFRDEKNRAKMQIANWTVPMDYKNIKND